MVSPGTPQPEDVRRRAGHRIVPVAAVLVGVAASCAAYRSVHELERKRVLARFELAANNSLSVLRTAVEDNVLSLTSIRGFAQEARPLTDEAFGDFVRPFFGYLGGLRALGWMPAEGLDDGEGAAADAARCRVELVEPLAGNEVLLGCDLSLDPVLHEALLQARDSGEAAMTGKLRLRDHAKEFGFWIVLPIYQDNVVRETPRQRRRALVGFVFGEFDYRGFVEDSLRRLPPQGIDLWLRDPVGEPGSQSLYVHASRVRTQSIDSDRLLAQLEHPGLVKTQALAMPGRSWQVQASPSPNSLAQWSTEWVSRSVLVVGLFLTLAVGGCLEVTHGRAARIERLVQARTAELKTSEATARALLDATDAAAYLLDLEGNVLAVNELGRQSLTDDVQEVVGAPLRRWLSPSRALCVQDLLGRALAVDVPVTIERKEGRSFFKYRCLPIHHAGGKVWRFALFISDTTERHRREETVRRHRDELARASRLSTIGEMATGLAHELNQPLGAICANVDACKRLVVARQQTELEEAVEDIASQAERAAAIVQRVRQFIGHQPIQMTCVDVNEVIRDSVGLSLPGPSKSEVHIDLDLADELPAVTGDAIQLQQVMVNLIRNAFEAMSGYAKDCRRLAIQSRMRDESLAGVSVTDSGPGLDPLVAERIFDPFFTTKSDGMGMGLAISRSIIRHHRGDLWAEAEGEGGTTFTFTLPCQTGESHELRRAYSVHRG